MRRALWVTPGGLPPAEPLRLALAELGWAMLAVDAIEAESEQPAVVVVDGEADEIEALRALPPHADVVRATAGAAVIAARLERLVAARDPQDATELDPQTGLPNRAHFARRLPVWVADRPAGGAHAVALLGIDPCNGIQEAHGSDAADRLLVSLCGVLLRWAAPRDLVARVGDEEFAIALTRIDTSLIRRDLDDLFDAVRALRLPMAPGLRVTLSAGLTWLVPQDTDAAAMARADAALQRARASGRDCLAVEEAVGGGRSEQQAELQRFMDITQVYGARLNQVVHTLSRRLSEGSRRDALHDRLTGIPNRRYFDDRMAREVEQARRARRPLSLLFLDLDDFGAINRRHGYACGDALLRRFAEVAAESIRLVDWLARWGGEEFCVVMPETGIDDAVAVAQRLRGAVAAAGFTTLDDQPLALTCSIGVATLGASTADVTALAEQGRLAARRAKAAGKNRVAVAAD